MIDQEPSASEAVSNASDAPVRVKVLPNELTYDSIKGAIYAQAKYLREKGRPMATLMLSRDLYEILNRRLVFKAPAHGGDAAKSEKASSAREKPFFITPYGNLRVEVMNEELDEPLSFIVSA
ncbi:MAG: hypothetical protein Q8922_04250 [Bacteroidota bacterium]|nr:hypothetical protein [Bacteroidota bacterium]MDP4231792.1 hypothetical protein [Bacteroidota bacterium]MDP4242678.1 hypothetical protein [Bacteroidota bacterium]MDP4287129.1 hypothetical protein [Bacteroidota bacterium]